MRWYRVRWWTGPTRVQHYARLLGGKPAFSAVAEGTEHVYFTLEARDEWDARAMVEKAIGKSFCRVEGI